MKNYKEKFTLVLSFLSIIAICLSLFLNACLVNSTYPNNKLTSQFTKSTYSLEELIPTCRRVRVGNSLLTGDDIERLVPEWKWAGVAPQGTVYKGIISEIGDNKLNKSLLVCKHPIQPISRLYNHIISSLLDQYFLSSNEDYTYSHIPLPFSWGKDHYYYLFVEGTEGFYGNPTLVLDEWNEAIGLFLQAGVYISHDISEFDSDYAKNIVLEPDFDSNHTHWKRIDFDSPASFRIDSDKLIEFLEKNRQELIDYLGNEKFELLQLATLWRLEGELTTQQMARFEYLFGIFQREIIESYLPS